MRQQELFGYLSLDGEKLLLDGIPLVEGQILLVRYGKGLLMHAQVNSRGTWYLNCLEFVGHTYVNVPFTAGFLGSKREEWSAFRVKSEQSARRVNSSTIARLRNRSRSRSRRSIFVNSRQHGSSHIRFLSLFCQIGF